jgi:glycosyltransferase involved in cell wall biosynthesis
MASKDTQRRLIKENNKIIFAGYQNDVKPYFAISNALVFPSYREGFPNVVLQASAMGLPSIVSDINGCNEIIENKINGLIVPVKNVEKLKLCMELLLTDHDLFRNLKKNAREIVLQKYQQKFIWNEILSEYNNLKIL